MKKILLTLLSGLAFAAAGAPVPPPGWELQVDTGVLKAGDASLDLLLFHSDWTPFFNGHSGTAPKWTEKASGLVRSGVLAGYRIEQEWDETPGNWQCSYTVSRQQNAPELQLATMVVRLPVAAYAGVPLLWNGKPVLLPESYGQPSLKNGSLRQIRIPTRDGYNVVISGKFSAGLYDDRRYNNAEYVLRLPLQPAANTAGTLRFTIAGWKNETEFNPVGLETTANMAFRDEQPGDGKGGWSDQGDNDLRNLPIGNGIFGGVPFRIANPETTDGKSCIVLGTTKQKSFPAEASVVLNGTCGAALYLLHASAWGRSSGPLGELTVHYTDGSLEYFPVGFDNEVGNWWYPRGRANGAIAWQSNNGEAEIGLYLSQFRLKTRPVEKIVLRNIMPSSAQGLWMIAGMTLGPILPHRMPCTAEPKVMTANDQWRPVNDSPQVIPGSALDFSELVPPNAGSVGRPEIKGDHFELPGRPGKKMRFWGINLCFGTNTLPAEKADKLADILRRTGYNSVRLHHYDVMLTGAGKSSLDFSPEALDRFAYLFSAMKRAGMYITMDLFSARVIREGEIPGFPANADYKTWVLLSDDAFANWKEFTRRLLTHINPYTGLALGRDPALISICLVNENGISPEGIRANPKLNALFSGLFNRWTAAHPEKIAGLSPRQQEFRCLSELLIERHRQMKEYLHEIGVDLPVTSFNDNRTMYGAMIRDSLDVVDNHSYADHPGFGATPWQMPFTFTQRSAVEAMIPNPTGIFPTRRYGAPFFMTELDFSYPNHYRAEGGPILGAYGALQGADGMWDFAYSHEGSWSDVINSPVPINTFDLAWDPTRRLSQRLVSALFLRGDAREATERIVFAIGDGGFASERQVNQEQARFGLYAKVGYIRWNCPKHPACRTIQNELLAANVPLLSYPEVSDPTMHAYLRNSYVPPTKFFDPARKRIMSSTGEILCDGAAGKLEVRTPRTECFVFSNTGKASGNFLKIEHLDKNPLTVGAIALNGASLSESSRILLLHLCDVQNSGAVFGDSEGKVWKEKGNAPALAQQTRSRLRLPNGNYTVYPLRFDGSRLAPLPPEADGSWLLDTFHGDVGVVMAYELVRE